MTLAPERKTSLVYVMGPSGAGKDTLIAYARACVDPTRILFAHRYITRPAGAGGENHIALSPAEFAARRSAGLFAIDWESHGWAYALGNEIDGWLQRGFLVVASGARTVWPVAQERYPGALGMLIDASAEQRASRLAARGREDAPAIRARLEREVSVVIDRTVRLDNSGPIARAGDVFVSLLEAAAKDL
jgi:ribose 1,5-bisphosphokinase